MITNQIAVHRSRAPQRRPPDQEALIGLWRRSLLISEGHCDRSSDVRWLQGWRRYVDLRQPLSAKIDFRSATCVDDLNAAQVAALASQEGFAGEFTLRGEQGTWHRQIDFQPAAGLPDCGRLTWEAGAGELVPVPDLLVEEGVYAPYREHWCRVERDQSEGQLDLSGSADSTPARWETASAVFEEEQTGRPVLLLRSGGWFAVAVGRPEPLPPGGSLSALVAGAATLPQARALIDCELSLGRVGPDGWLIERSSLPWQVGVTFDSAVHTVLRRGWRLIDLEGDESLLSG